jgi:hypothetical protein
MQLKKSGLELRVSNGGCTANADLVVKGYQSLFDLHLWDIWFSTTVSREVGTEDFLRSFKYFFNHINSRDFVFYKGFICGYVFSEFNKFRNGVHLHALIKGIDPEMANPVEEFCWDYFGESKVVPYDNYRPDRASGYLARKCVSQELDHFDFFKVNSSFRGRC